MIAKAPSHRRVNSSTRNRPRGDLPRSLKDDCTRFVLSNTNACQKMKSMHKLRILILYPDPAGLALLTSMLKSLGHIIEESYQ